MRRSANVVGPNVTKFRHQRGWTQNELATKLQLLGCNITPQTVANIETRRTSVGDGVLVFFTKVFRINVAELFPDHWRVGSQIKQLADLCPTRRFRKSRRRSRKRRLSK